MFERVYRRGYFSYRLNFPRTGRRLYLESGLIYGMALSFELVIGVEDVKTEGKNVVGGKFCDFPALRFTEWRREGESVEMIRNLSK